MTRFQLEEYLGLFPTSVRLLRANRRIHCPQRVPFGPHPRQFLLACLPPAGTVCRPVGILFAHGGGWRMGSPAQFRFVGSFLASLGFPTVLVGYRLAPAVKFPAQWEDLALGCQVGIQALRQQGLVPEEWILGGQSAGAQLAALLAFADPARCRALFGRLAGLFLVSGPLDFSVCEEGEVARLIDEYVGDERNRALADPMRYVHGDETLPVLCIHGDRDPLVPPQNSANFAARVGPRAQVYWAEGWHHSDLVEIFLRPELAATRALVAWLDTVA